MLNSTIFAERRQRVRNAVADDIGEGIPFIVADSPNVAYLTGLSASNAAILIAPDGADQLCTDGRYLQMAHAVAPDLDVVVARASAHQLVHEAVGQGYQRLMIEGSLPAMLVEECGSSATLIIGNGIVEQLRRIKDQQETALLAMACRITAEAFQILAEEIRVGQTEALIARRLELLFAELGAEDRAFASIVATGPNAAIPHHSPGSQEIRVGDLLVIDAGARVGGYHADMTRTFMVGTEASAEFIEWHDAVIEARTAALQRCTSGAPATDMDTAARAVLSARGYGELMPHGLGHGIGLQIHEAPMLTVTQRQGAAHQPTGAATGGQHRLESDMVIAVEPGVYKSGVGGIRIEDSFQVTAGEPLTLTRTADGTVPTGLQIVGEA